MKFKHKKENYEKQVIPTKGLYVALIGRIYPEFISENIYIHRGEEGIYYTIVRKLDDEDNYIDILNNTSYLYRDENSNYTVLKLDAFSSNKEYTDIGHLQNLLNAFDEIINEKQLKPADNKVYARTRKR